MRNRWFSGTLGLLVAALLVGCSGSVPGQAEVGSSAAASTTGRTLGAPGSADTTDATAPPSTPRATTTPSDDTISAQTAPTQDDTDPTDVIGSISLGANDDGYLLFQSPTGNIFCGLFDDADFAEARCDIIDHSYDDPPARDCGDSGFAPNAATVGADGTGVVGICAGDTVADPQSPVLAYGRNAGTGRFACHSAGDGITCANLDSGHGFRLARAAYLLF